MLVALMAVFIVAGSAAVRHVTKVLAAGGTAEAPAEDTAEDMAEDKKKVVVVRNSRTAYGIGSSAEDTIRDYLNTWFGTLAELKEQDVTQYFDLSDSQGAVSAAIDQAALSFLVGVRSLQDNDLTLTGYTCGVTYTGAETLENGDLSVTLEEDHAVQFSFIDGTDSYSSGIEHTFVIRQEGNNCRIIEHQKEEDGYLLIEELYDEESQGAARTQTSQLLNQIKSELMDQARQDIEALNAEKSESAAGSESAVLCDHDYDRTAAVAYAMDWVDPLSVIRNDTWGLYDEYGGNCNNYISQCLYAGGIPMDTEGEDQWKWYGDSVNTRQTESGRSGSWAGVEEFYDYAESNTGYGLAADTTANLYAGQAGDILQYGVDGEWNHSVIITDVVTDADGSVKDYLINSNTTDRINYPASAYAYSDLRLIRVLGWND